ncbi:glycosyltransferase [Hoeflea prorocentri]|uniref:Glycosyltransferase n=1 Tax=Hoeflea prorocentri TaxID=1922333 RepID=A0A9X3UML8_9HYPH|nr:glycosyltransferase [Hoeflea prorocentri]MCY6381979.1 glycosyltransferase [Hoeflea prorocentri]MDA5399779.1 glycosyltransferase [Hoeflea prorocentri]
MIPKIIHQTWRDENIPDNYLELVDSWKRLNPDWEYRLWTDNDLDTMVVEHFPEFLDQFRAYPNPVQRADAGRYMVLYLHGGVYADLDTRCNEPFDLLWDEERIVLAHEPLEHLYEYCRVRQMDHLLFNGTMVSPKDHPFWLSVFEAMERARHSRDVMDSTGPVLLTNCVKQYSDPDSLCINSCQLFNPLTKQKVESEADVFGDYAGHRLSTHYWFGTWYQDWYETPLRRFKKIVRKTRYHLTRGEYLSRSEARSLVDRTVLDIPLNGSASADDQNIQVLIPARDAEPFLERCVELLRALDYPKDKIKIAFCEGDSVDNTWDRLQALCAELRTEFADVICLKKETGASFNREKRWKPKLQKKRRIGLAKVRNHLIDNALDGEANWALWIDADVCDYPPDILKRLLHEREKIVVPNCVLEPGGACYDLNSFTVTDERRDSGYYKYVRNGLYAPPGESPRRLHFNDLRSSERVELFGVGGTMLLVHASVHRAGIRFPEIPYCDLLETEGFGYWARDCGVIPIGLPNVEIRHVRS